MQKIPVARQLLLDALTAFNFVEHSARSSADMHEFLAADKDGDIADRHDHALFGQFERKRQEWASANAKYLRELLGELSWEQGYSITPDSILNGGGQWLI